MENYELLVDKKYNKKLLKGQSRKGKKARQYEPSNKDSITSGYVTALNGLEDGEMKNLFQRVLNCDLEMKSLITEGKEIKKRGRFNFKLKELMGCDTDNQVLKRLGKNNTVNTLFEQYGYAFSAAKKNAPASMANDVNKMNTKWMATQEALQKARQRQREDFGTAVDAVGEATWDKTIELDSIFLDNKTFRGSKDPVGGYDENRIGKNQFRIVQQDVIEECKFDLTLDYGYSHQHYLRGLQKCTTTRVTHSLNKDQPVMWPGRSLSLKLIISLRPSRGQSPRGNNS
jgi:hypothetical protein